jgi:alkyl hydroperoxide reductase subunit AhpC
VLKYSDKPVLCYSDKKLYDGVNDIQREIMADSQPMASAPQNAARPIVVIEPNGNVEDAMYYRGSWRVMAKIRDEYTGQLKWQMQDRTVANPIRWREGK